MLCCFSQNHSNFGFGPLLDCGPLLESQHLRCSSFTGSCKVGMMLLFKLYLGKEEKFVYGDGADSFGGGIPASS